MTPEQQPSVPDWHPEVETISEYAEGLLEPAQEAVVAAHLEHCELCAEVQDSLSEISSLLGELTPAAMLMPADVAARIDAALAAEPFPVSRETAIPVSRETPAEEDSAIPVSRETETGAGDVSRETRPPRSAAHGPHGPFGHAPTTTGPGRGRPRRRGRRALIGTALGAALLGGLTFFGQTLLSPDDSDSGSLADRPAAEKRNSEGASPNQDLNEETLGGRVSELLGSEPQRFDSTQKKPSESPGTSAPQSPDTKLSEGYGATNVPSCLRQAVPATGTPIAVQQETVRGEPALLLVFTNPRNADYVDAYVVDLRCASDSSVQAELLLRDTYRRP
ncbi:hypothetical protein AB0M28_31660 [Streptomyces sp. NPDC051940]|uniref:hypothetical protein n=1 Tax=Streptomyces sp. NPDC051940 TaxID=3155675 RepID=UPI00342FE45D